MWVPAITGSPIVTAGSDVTRLLRMLSWMHSHSVAWLILYLVYLHIGLTVTGNPLVMGRSEVNQIILASLLLPVSLKSGARCYCSFD